MPTLVFRLAGDVSGTPKTASDALTISVPGSARFANRSLSLTDTYGIGIAEEPTTLVEVQVSDLLSVSTSGPPNISLPIQKFSTEFLDFTVDEALTRDRVKYVVDALNVQINDGLIVRDLTRSDSISIGVTGAIAARSLLINDALNFAVVGSQNTSRPGTRSLIRPDDFYVGLNDAVRSVRQAKSVTETLTVSLTDSATAVVFNPVSDTDSIAIALIEVASVEVIYQNVQESWDYDNQPWGGPLAEEVAYRPVLPIGDAFYQVNPAIATRAGEALNTVLERIGIVPADPTNILLMTSMHPLVRAPAGTVFRIYAGMQDSPEDPITWQGPFNYVVGSSYFVDPVLSGRYLSLRIETEGQPAWRLMSLDIGMQESGRH